jgi:hypothetical protein
LLLLLDPGINHGALLLNLGVVELRVTMLFLIAVFVLHFVL